MASYKVVLLLAICWKQIMIGHYLIMAKTHWRLHTLIDLRPCQHDNGNMNGRLQIKVHTDERTQVHSARSSLAVTHLRTNRVRRYLTSVTELPSKYWSPTRLHNRLMAFDTVCHSKLLNKLSAYGMHY